MPQLGVVIPDEYLHVITIDGMTGRYAQIPAKKPNVTNQILLLYGHHSSLERMYSTGQYLSRYGTVTILDLPGFGGMDSFYRVGKRPSVDNYGQYLMRATRQVYGTDTRFSALCMSFSFMMYARALQLDKELAKQTQKLVAFVGFLNKEDFRYGPIKHALYSTLAWIVSRPPMVLLAKLFLFNKYLFGPLLHAFFMLNPNYKSASKFKQEDVEAMERDLWLINDLRTHFRTVLLMLNAKFPNTPINHAVTNVMVDKDQYFDHERVRRSMESIFTSYKALEAKIGAHAPSIISSEEEVAAIMPTGLKQELTAT